MNKWTKLLLVTILIAGLVVGMSNALPTRAAPGDVIARINAGGPAVGGWSEDRVTSVVDDQYWLCDGVLQA
ncbi:MAG TPA: hypothetical protein VKY39_04200, partial [Aggregatilineales bacterium]|nr:hypothetical protein [Aggregatilineales bacterium]